MTEPYFNFKFHRAIIQPKIHENSEVADLYLTDRPIHYY